MREERTLRREFFHRFKRPLHRRMRGVRFVPERVEKQYIQAAQLLHRLVGNVAVIGEIRRRAEAEAMHRALAVAETDRHELQAKQFNGRAVENVCDQPWHGGFGKSWIENIAEAALDV